MIDLGFSPGNRDYILKPLFPNEGFQTGVTEYLVTYTITGKGVDTNDANNCEVMTCHASKKTKSLVSLKLKKTKTKLASNLRQGQ